MGREATCGAQTYWYESGVQRAKFCGLPATSVTEALDGSRNNGCDRHAAMAVEAGARDVTPPARKATPEPSCCKRCDKYGPIPER